MGLKENNTGLGLILLIGLVFLGSLMYCPDKYKSYHKSKKISNGRPDTVYVFDTIPKIITKPYLIRVTDTFLLPGKIDTLAVIGEHNTKRTYNRNYQDSNLKLEISDTVYQNSLAWGPIVYKLLKPTQIIQQTTVIQRNGLFIDLNTTIGQDFGIAPGATLTRERKKYQVSYDLINRQLQIGIGIRITSP